MESKTAAVNSAPEDKVEAFSIKNFLGICLGKWKWFLLSLVFFIGVGVLYIIRQQPVYERYTDVLIKDEDMGASASITSAFASMGLVSSNTSVNNELITLISPAIMSEVVSRLHLEMNYAEKKLPHDKTLYGSNLPIIVEFLDFDTELSAGFQLHLNPDGSGEVFKCYSYDEFGDKHKYKEKIRLPKGGEIVKTPMGRVRISANPDFDGHLEEPMTIRVGKSGFLSTVEKYTDKLKGDLVDQDAEVIDLSIKDVSPRRAVDILRSVVDIYNENWIEDKNRMAIATSAFIDERLKVIQSELGDVDTDISEFKSAHKVPDIQAAARTYMEENSKQSQQVLDATNQLAMAGFLRDYVNNSANTYNVIPVNTGVGNEALNRQITDYNTLLLARNNLVKNSSVTNPIASDYDQQLKGMRDAIVRGVNSTYSQLSASLKNIQKAYGETEQQLSSSPKQAKQLLSAERQQRVKQELYLYLLQKREENELTQTFTAYNTKIITPPTGPLEPVSPKKKLILIACFLLGVSIPAAYFYILESNITTIRSRKDLDNIPMPFAGEVPQVGGKAMVKRLFAGKKKKKQLSEAPLAVVEEGNRDVVNEAFRVIRSNIEFMVGKEKGCHVMLLTSFNPGSGKSFISYNLAVALSLKKKRVLLIDGDLRHGSASTYVGKHSKGLSNYLTSNIEDWHSLLVSVADHPTMQVLPIGKTPPNPAELLENGRFGELIKEARDEYDYILVDCPPVDIVVDTQIIEKYADSTVFVVRAGLLEKSALPDLADIYNSKKYKHMSLILNGTDASHSRYHTYGNYQSIME